VLSLPFPHRWPPRRGLTARATWRRRPRRGVSIGLPLLLAPPTYLVGAQGFGSRPRPATRRTTTPAINLCGGGDSDQDGSMEVDFR
jgi:hypothetical protein